MTLCKHDMTISSISK